MKTHSEQGKYALVTLPGCVSLLVSDFPVLLPSECDSPDAVNHHDDGYDNKVGKLKVPRKELSQIGFVHVSQLIWE